jgi:uncharacterized membrane protein
MRISFAELLARLRVEGLATDADAAAVRKVLVQADDDDIPWYMRILVGIGAWAATLFLIAFVAMLDVVDGDGARLIAGALLIGGAIAVRRGAESEFVRQTTLAMSLAGQGLVIFSIAKLFSDNTAALAGVALAVTMIVLMPDRISRFLSTIIGSVAALVAAVELEVWHGGEFIVLGLVALAAYVWRGALPARSDETSELLEPVGYGLLVAVFGMLTFGAALAFGTLTRELGHATRSLYFGELTTLGITVALGVLILSVLEEHDIPLANGLTFGALAAALALALGTLSSPGIIAGIMVLLLGFDRRNAVLVGLSVVYLLVFGSMYYYSLQLTLLEKSGVLVGSGLLFLGLHWELSRRAPRSVGAQ